MCIGNTCRPTRRNSIRPKGCGVTANASRPPAAWWTTAAQLELLAREAPDAADEQRLLRGFIRGTGLPFRFDLPTRKHQSETQ